MIIVQTDFPAAEAAQWVRQACAGVAEVFRRDAGVGYLALGSAPGRVHAEVASRPAEILFAGGRTGAEAGPWLFMVGLWTPQEDRDELLSWYREEHLPVLLECAEWQGCRFVEERVPQGCQFYALHQLADRSALDSSARKRSRATPWFFQLKRHAWFDEPFTRTLYRRVSE